MFTVNK